MRCAGTFGEVAESRLSFTAGFVAFFAAEYCLIIVSSHRFDPQMINRTMLFPYLMSFSSTIYGRVNLHILSVRMDVGRRFFGRIKG